MVSLDHHGCRIVGDLKSGQRVQASEAPGFCIFNTADRFCVFGTSVMHIAQSLQAYGDQPIVNGLGTLDLLFVEEHVEGPCEREIAVYVFLFNKLFEGLNMRNLEFRNLNCGMNAV
jgi:hypothetical protein